MGNATRGGHISHTGRNKVRTAHLVRGRAQHHNRRLAEGLSMVKGVKLDPAHVQTNIIIFDLSHPEYTISDFLDKLREQGILALPTRGGIRFVCHKDVDDTDVDRAVETFRRLLNR